jgi:hypothetical protein
MWGFLSDRYFPLQPYDFPLHLGTGRGGYRLSFRALGLDQSRPPAAQDVPLGRSDTWIVITFLYTQRPSGFPPVATGHVPTPPPLRRSGSFLLMGLVISALTCDSDKLVLRLI